MDIKDFVNKNEKPLDNLVKDGGFCGIFRKIACIGDSLSSGEMESLDENGQVGWHDYFEYSWGQYIARDCGMEVLNFSRGGMTAKRYLDAYATETDAFAPEKKCQAYIIALGVNDISGLGKDLGDISDIDIENPENNKSTFVGDYAKIIQKYKALQPQARFFLMTIPDGGNRERKEAEDLHRELLYKIADLFDYTYVLDFRKYAPLHDSDFKKNFYLAGHLNAAGYMLTARMVESYIDYIIRNNMEDFAQVAFIGKGIHNHGAKW